MLLYLFSAHRNFTQSMVSTIQSSVSQAFNGAIFDLRNPLFRIG